ASHGRGPRRVCRGGCGRGQLMGAGPDRPDARKQPAVEEHGPSRPRPVVRAPRGRSRRDNRGTTISNGSRAARRSVGRREGTGKGRMSRRIALVTCADLPDLDPDDRLLLAHLAWHGVTVVPAVWDDP